MSEDDDILAIVAALEFLSSRDEAPAPRSKWNESARLYEDDDRERTWKNS